MIPGWAKKYIGIPFKWQGDTKSGCDCYGLVRLVMREQFGITCPDYAYSDAKDALRDAFAQGLRQKDTWRQDMAREGNIILLAINGHPLHCGLVLDESNMLHASQGANVCIERFNMDFWRSRHMGFYRHKDIPI